MLTYRAEEGEESDGDTDSDSQEVPELVAAGSEGPGISGNTEGSVDVNQEEEEYSDRESRVLMEVDEKPREKWDCESILR